jgi:hypothetical protein
MLSTIMAPKNLASVIVVSYQRDGNWTPLEVAPFSGEHADIEPAFSPDGDTLFFASKRPKPDREGSDWDLWRVAFRNRTWGEPEHLGDEINTPGNEFYPSVSSNGTLYFTATREDTIGKEDLYRVLVQNGKYTGVENLGEPVNSTAYEFNAFIAPDESYLIFGSQGRETNIGGGDLYISYRQDGKFAAPKLLSSKINTARLDYCPSVHHGYFYYTSEKISDANEKWTMQDMAAWYDSPGNGLGNIYRISFNEILAD